MLSGIEDLAANHIVVLAQAGKVAVTVFIQTKKIADDNDQTARADRMAYAFKCAGQRFLFSRWDTLRLQPVDQSLDHPHCAATSAGRSQFPMTPG
jgi:hypothetical protein